MYITLAGNKNILTNQIHPIRLKMSKISDDMVKNENNLKVYDDVVKLISEVMGNNSKLEQILFTDKKLAMAICIDSYTLLQLGDYLGSKRLI